MALLLTVATTAALAGEAELTRAVDVAAAARADDAIMLVVDIPGC